MFQFSVGKCPYTRRIVPSVVRGIFLLTARDFFLFFSHKGCRKKVLQCKSIKGQENERFTALIFTCIKRGIYYLYFSLYLYFPKELRVVEGCHGWVGVGEPVPPHSPLTTPLARLRPPAQLKKGP